MYNATLSQFVMWGAVNNYNINVHTFSTWNQIVHIYDQVHYQILTLCSQCFFPMESASCKNKFMSQINSSFEVGNDPGNEWPTVCCLYYPHQKPPARYSNSKGCLCDWAATLWQCAGTGKDLQVSALLQLLVSAYVNRILYIKACTLSLWKWNPHTRPDIWASNDKCVFVFVCVFFLCVCIYVSTKQHNIHVTTACNSISFYFNGL